MILRGVQALLICAWLLAGPWLAVTASAQMRYLEGHTEPVYAVTWSPDGRTLVSGSFDKTVRVWDAASGQPRRTLSDHTDMVLAVAISPDGRQLATAGFDKTVKVYDLPLVGPVADLANQPGAGTAVCLSADGKLLVTGDRAGSVRLWNTIDNCLLREFVGAPGEISAVAITRDGKQVLAASTDGTLRGWNAENAQPIGAVSISRINSLAILPNGKTILAGCDDGVIRSVGWPPAALSTVEAGSSDAKSMAVSVVAVSPNQALIAAAGDDAHVRIWNRADGTLARDLVLLAAARSVAFSADGKRLAVVGGNDQPLQLYEISSGILLEQLPSIAGQARSASFTADGKQVAVALGDGSVRGWTPAVTSARPLQTGPIRDLALSADGKQAFTCGDDKLVAAWTVAEFKQARRFEGAPSAVVGLDRSGDGRFLAGVTQDGRVQIWNAGNAQALLTAEMPSPATAALFNQDGTRLIVACSDNVVRNYTLAPVAGMFQLTLVQEFSGHAGRIAGASLSSDGKNLYTVADDRSVKRWLAAAPGVRLNLAGHTAHVYSLAFSPDGLRLASGSADKSIRLWDTVDGKNYATCNGHSAQVYSVAFHPTQPQFASCGADKTLRLWNPADGSQNKQLDQEITDALYSVEFSRDGSQLLAGGLAKTWQIWNFGEDKPLRTVPGHSDHIYRAVFGPAGARVATLGYGGNLHIWDAASGSQIFKQELPFKTCYAFAYSPDGTQIAVVGLDNRVLTLTLPEAAR